MLLAANEQGWRADIQSEHFTTDLVNRTLRKATQKVIFRRNLGGSLRILRVALGNMPVNDRCDRVSVYATIVTNDKESEQNVEVEGEHAFADPFCGGLIIDLLKEIDRQQSILVYGSDEPGEKIAI